MFLYVVERIARTRSAIMTIEPGENPFSRTTSTTEIGQQVRSGQMDDLSPEHFHVERTRSGSYFASNFITLLPLRHSGQGDSSLATPERRLGGVIVDGTWRWGESGILPGR